jgi:DNA topoisomerase-1
MKLVIVESPAKAKTINKYLGSDYQVLASYGHVRDLKEKDGAVEPDNDFAMHWEVGDRARRPLGEIGRALRDADTLILATDPDREGEAISWHLQEVLRQERDLRIPVKRVVFNEITRAAVVEAMRNPRDVDPDLVDAYMARRALDYLVGFTLSPVLWRKLPGSKSAGRVQSVALRLICERESEIERFRPQEYWTVDVAMTARSGGGFTARLTELDGRKLDKFDLATAADAERAVATILAGDPYRVAKVERKRVRRNPLPPFTTSTLQQEASTRASSSTARRSG